MKQTVKRELMLGTAYVTFINDYSGVWIIVEFEGGKREEKSFISPKEAKRYAYEEYGAYFE